MPSPTAIRPLALLVLALPSFATIAARAETAPTDNAGTAPNGWVRLDKPQTDARPGQAVSDMRPLPAVPLAGDQDDRQQAACRVRKTVEAGVAMGSVSGTHVGAELAYGRDDRALAAGYPPTPCPETGFAMSVRVSQTDAEIKSRRRHYRDSYNTALDPYGRPLAGAPDLWAPDQMDDIGRR